MLNKLLTLALGGTFVLGTAGVLAQETSPSQAAQSAQDQAAQSAQDQAAQSAQDQVQKYSGKKKNMDADQQLQRLTEKLNLSSAQQSQIKPILEDRQQKMQALHQDESISQTDKHSQAKSIMDDSNSKIEAVLNDNQKQKFEAMQQKKSEKRHGMNGTDETSPSTTPPDSQPQ